MLSETGKGSLVLCASDALPYVAFRSNEWVCWLHITAQTWSSFDVAVTNLVVGGCSMIYVTGSCAKLWHDNIDDCLIAMGREDVLTAYGELEFSDCIGEFWDISRRYSKIRLFASIGECHGDERKFWSELLSSREVCSE
jgi:hypothetical protein